MSSSGSIGPSSATATVHCYRKQFARPGGIKGPPRAPKEIQRDGPTYLVLPFGPDAVHQTYIRDVCRDALLEYKNWQLPHITESHSFWSNVVANDQSFSCFLGTDPRSTRGEVTRPVFLDVKELPLRALLSFDEYQARSFYTDKPYYRAPRNYFWQTKDMGAPCWSIRHDDACIANIENVCGTPYREPSRPITQRNRQSITTEP